ncbi:FAD-dependent monooxygenase [Sulfobacillus harzensis]|uniref:FAD-binding domain-containing protein n=1 Tax=Sulfobacillus harzensis TaxID=2729629 RepID=A0A7Y0L590_9FIRM|nr:FAD-dependent monooxygenase [Sulfobacillus harzensis]NMP23197.1 hypothetical protein [Sulfobacillus harzensis]
MDKREQLDIAIVGGGVAGLALGAFLQDSRWNFHLFEARSAADLTGGAALAMAPNAMWVLRKLGIAGQVTKAGSVIRHYHFNTWQGASLKIVDMNPLSKGWGENAWCVPRADLLAALKGKLLPSQLDLESPVGQILVDAKGLLLDVPPEPVRARTLVGADGAWSIVRQHFWPIPAPTYQGFVAARGTLKWRLPEALRDSVMQIWGPRGEFGYAPMGSERVYWFATLPWSNPEQLPDRDHLMAHFRGWCQPTADLMTATPDPDLLIHPIFDRPEGFTPLTHPVTLIGDAAHLMTPNTGQGACQSLLDAYVLGTLLGRGHDPAEAFSTYRTIRLPRALFVARLSRNLGHIIHHPSTRLRVLRDRLIALAPEFAVRRGMAKAVGTPPALKI